jgi:hypothetical protein
LPTEAIWDSDFACEEWGRDPLPALAPWARIHSQRTDTLRCTRKLKLLGSESMTDEGWFGAMTVINALLCTAFLILVAVSAAVTGSMVGLGLMDWAFGKKKDLDSAALESSLDREQADEIDEYSSPA